MQFEDAEVRILITDPMLPTGAHPRHGSRFRFRHGIRHGAMSRHTHLAGAILAGRYLSLGKQMHCVMPGMRQVLQHEQRSVVCSSHSA